MANNNKQQPGKKDESLANYQQAGQQLLQLNAERQKNIALQRQALAAQQGNTNLLAEAGAMANMGGGATVNPQTQAMLSKYGYGRQPRVQRAQGREVRIAPNNIVVNNNYNTVTNNNVIPQQGGGRGNEVANNQSRFKTWLSGVFARQREETSRRDREFQKQEWTIGKSTNRMLRQMTEAGRSVAEAVNPRNIGSTLNGQIKTLLFLFGMKFLSKNWTRVLKITTTIAGYIEKGLAFFGIGNPKTVKDLASRGEDFRGRFITFFAGADRARDGKTTIISLLKEMVGQFGDFIKTFIEGQMEIRGMAIKSIKFPTLNFKPADSSGWDPLAGKINSAISSLGSSLTTALSGIGTYLGDVFTALVNPKAGAKRAVTSNAMRLGAENAQKAQEYDRNVNRFTAVKAWDGDKAKSGWTINAGDAANELVGNNKQRRYSLLEGSIEGDKLRDTAGAQVSQGRDLLGAIRDVRGYGRIDTARFASGVSRLYESAKTSSNGGVIVDQEFINMFLGAEKNKALRKHLESTKDLVPVKMKYVIADLDPSEYGNRSAENYRDTKRAADSIGVGKISLLGGALSYGVTKLGEGVNSLGTHLNTKKLILVPESDPRPAVTKINDAWGLNLNSVGDVKDLGKPTSTYYRLTPAAIEKIIQYQVGKDVDIENYETFLPGVDKFLTRVGGGKDAVNQRWANSSRKYSDFVSDRFGNNQRDYDVTKGFAEIKRIELAEQKLKSEMENHQFMTYVNHVKENSKKAFNAGVGLVNKAISWVGTTTFGREAASERITNKQIRANAQRIMDHLINSGGFTPEQALGIVGNLYRESNLNPGAVNNNDRGKQSIGLAQWRAERNARLRAFAQNRGTDWRNLNTQLDYLLWELQNEERGANRDIRSAGSFQEAAYAWRNFERYAGYRGGIGEGENAIRQGKTWSVYNMLKRDGYFDGRRLDNIEGESGPIISSSSSGGSGRSISTSSMAGGSPDILNGGGNEVTSDGIVRANVSGDTTDAITNTSGVTGPKMEIKGSEKSIFGDNYFDMPFKNIKSDEELKQQEIKSAAAREAVKMWETYPELKNSWENYTDFENYWLSKTPKLRYKLSRGFMAFHNHHRAIQSDPTLTSINAKDFAEAWASKPKEPWEMIKRVERGKQFGKISQGAEAFADKMLNSKPEDIGWMLDSLNKGPDSNPFSSHRGTAWQDRTGTTTSGLKNAYKDLYNDILAGKKSAGYGDDIAASVLFGDDYNNLHKELKDTEWLISASNPNGDRYKEAVRKKKSLTARIGNFEESAKSYVKDAKGKSDAERRDIFAKNQEIAEIKNQLEEYEEKREAIKANFDKKLLNWSNMSMEEINKLELDAAADIAWVNDKEESLRERLLKVMDGLGEEQAEFKLKLEQEIKLQKKSGEELLGEFKDLTDSGKTQIESLGEMMREYGKDVLEKLRLELAKTIEFFKTHQLTEEMFDVNYDPSEKLSELDKIQEEKKELIRKYGKDWMKYAGNLLEREEAAKTGAVNVQNVVQGNKALSDKGLASPIPNSDEMYTKAEGVIKKVDVMSKNKRVMNYTPGWEGWGGSGFDENYTSMAPDEKPKFYKIGELNKETGTTEYNSIGKLVLEGKRQKESGKAVGGYTEPGNPLTPSGYVLHKNEFVVSSKSLKNPLISEIVKAIDIYQGSNSSSKSPSTTKESVLTAESSKITAINTAETNARLEQLTQAVINLGRSGGTPKVRVPSYTS